MSFTERTEKAATILGIKQEKLTEHLKSQGIEDCSLLDAITTTVSDIETILYSLLGEFKSNIILKVRAAVSFLRGIDPFLKTESTESRSELSTIKALFEANKPITNWSDKDVLEGYIESNRDDLEAELQRRSKGQPFIVLKEGSNEEVDINASLMMLKKARKEIIPSIQQTPDKRTIQVFKVENYHIDNRIRYESPLRPGVTLFDGYCPQSKFNFTKVSEKARQMLRLIYEKEGKMNHLQEKQLVDTAENGEIELATLYPEIYIDFKEKEIMGTLPKLTIVAPLETKKADPFYQAGNHRSY
jgi:hypothetical protein